MADEALKVLTFGSCLSRYSINALRVTRKIDLKGVVYHNRIDRFVKHYVYGNGEREPQDLVGKFKYSASVKARVEIMLKNQYRHLGLGKYTLRKDQPGFLEALNEPVDLIVLDNFVDLVSKLAVSKKTGNASLFLNFKDISNINELCDLEKNYLDIKQAIAYWHRFITFLREKQPDALIIFLNFPMQHHPSASFRQRGEEFYNLFKDDRILVIPNLPVHSSQIESPSHFTPLQYSLYAGLFNVALENRDFLEHRDVNDADKVLRERNKQ
jgi:hypothetical protein